MKKFDDFMNSLLDPLTKTIILGVILFILFSWLFNCSTPQTTKDLQTKAEATEEAIDKGQDGCKSLECQEAMKQSKSYIRESLDTVKAKDKEIVGLNDWIQTEAEKWNQERWELKEQIKELESEIEPWRTIKRYFYYLLGLLGVSVIIYILYLFRSAIWTLLKTFLKIV